MVKVERKLEEIMVEPPDGIGASDDDWAAFRRIEVIDFPLTFDFRHSLGKLSRFFLELENQRLMGTSCPVCHSVWLPPRILCPDHHAVNDWVELGSRGILEAFSISSYALGTDSADEHMVLAYVKLHGAKTALLQQMRNVPRDKQIEPGMPVKVVWSKLDVQHPMQLFWFELDI